MISVNNNEDENHLNKIFIEYDDETRVKKLWII